MRKKHLKSFIFILLITVISIGCKQTGDPLNKTRILISTDIGGTDPDDFQSIIHLFMYANEFEIEGLVSSPYGPGRKSHILEMIDLYEEDLPKLEMHADGFPSPDYLRSISKQGGIDAAPFKGWTKPTEGSEWIIQAAKKVDDRPLWILVWGGIDDIAQALHDAPEITENIRVYWIGGPNKKWGVNAYTYVAENHPDLWMIEANATYRGWFLDGESSEDLTNDNFFKNHIKANGALGADFKNHYNGSIKMGDTPSLAYLMNGNPNDPTGESWGGSFVKIKHSTKDLFEPNTTLEDTVTVYSIIEWYFDGPEIDIPLDSSCFTADILGQEWPGYYLGSGKYGIRYSSKKPEAGSYRFTSDIPGFVIQEGQYVSENPWPGNEKEDDIKLGGSWYSDNPAPELFFGVQQGARTVSKWRSEFLSDWAERWDWLE
ncbi:MAG: nucleoside hydrolase-like domain-containing protein [Bacteroidota bacterium]